jgi:hypothetical protein
LSEEVYALASVEFDCHPRAARSVGTKYVDRSDVMGDEIAWACRWRGGCNLHQISTLLA